MDPLLIVIITFGLIFVVTASLGNGLSITVQSVSAPLQAHKPLNVMLLLSNFIVLPVLLIGLAAILPFTPQVKMAIVALALSAGAPFIPWLVSLAKGDLGYSASAVILLTLGTFVVLPLALPVMLNLLGTGATPSAWLVLWPMLLFMALPLVVGMFIRARYLKLAMELGQYLGPISITFLVVHIALFLGYSWSDVVSLAGGGVLAFALVFPLAGMLIGYLLSPPYILSPIHPADPQRGTKIVSAVAVAQQNTGAAICCAIFALGAYTVAGDMILVGAITTIVIVMLTMAELGARYEKKQAVATPPSQASRVEQMAKPSN
jgi:bile acid:Na+ symporter, BASS family